VRERGRGGVRERFRRPAKKSSLPLTLPTLLLFLATTLHAEPVTLWIGTGGKDAKGIYRTVLDTEKGTLTEPQLAAEIGSPRFLTLNADRSRLYCVCNVDGGSVAAWQPSPSARTSPSSC